MSKLFLGGVGAAFLGTVQSAKAVTTTALIMSLAMASVPTCLFWRPSGVCVWLFCTPFGCSIRTSVRVSHYNPDLVISAFHAPESHPWIDWGLPLNLSAAKAGAGLLRGLLDSAGTRSRADRTDKNWIYRDADAIGHPYAFLASQVISGSGMVCPSAATPFFPYMNTYLDAWAWRDFLPVEMLYPATYIPGLREVGTWPLNTWGSVFPRDGNTLNQNPVKAAAVIAQRIGDIVTRAGEPHIYRPLKSNGVTVKNGMLTWLPPSLIEGIPLTGIWQMVSPVPQPVCHVFGVNDSISPTEYGTGTNSSTGSYTFALWRPYSCCKVRGQTLITVIATGP